MRSFSSTAIVATISIVAQIIHCNHTKTIKGATNKKHGSVDDSDAELSTTTEEPESNVFQPFPGFFNFPPFPSFPPSYGHTKYSPPPVNFGLPPSFPPGYWTTRRTVEKKDFVFPPRFPPGYWTTRKTTESPVNDDDVDDSETENFRLSAQRKWEHPRLYKKTGFVPPGIVANLPPRFPPGYGEMKSGENEDSTTSTNGATDKEEKTEMVTINT